MVDLPLTDSPAAADSGDAAHRLALRVQAWQHRHPLARRIAPGEVTGLGVIALPYGPAGPLYHEPRLLPGLSHDALAAFAQAHAMRDRPGPADWPRRDVERADASAGPAPETRYLLTAAIASARPRAGAAHRLLIAPTGPAIWGRREWSRPRLALAAMAVLLLVVLAAALAWRGLAQPAQPAPGTAATPAAQAHPVPAPPASPVASVPAAAAVPANGPASSALVASAPAPAPALASAPAAPAGPHYALVSAPARKRAAAEATLLRVQQLLGPAMGHLQAQILPSPEGFVVTIWPLPTQADAERLADVLARRGVAMKWLEF